MSFERDAFDKNAPLIEGRGIGHAFGRHTVLTGIDVSVTAGEIVTLIGPNGAGKTTLVRILMGLIAPTSGTVQRREGLVVGYLPQNFQIGPVLPINVRRLLCLTGSPSEEDMIDSLQVVGAAHVMDEPVHTLSGGELQRVLLARALLRNPDLLVLDEPIAGIDVGGQIALYGLITKIRTARNCGVLMISHDLHLVMSATDRVMCINQHVCCSGQPEAVSRDPAYIALFGSQAAKSLAVYTHAHDHEHDLSGHVVPHHDHHHHDHDHPHDKDTETHS